jgi:hypothetical protein
MRAGPAERGQELFKETWAVADAKNLGRDPKPPAPAIRKTSGSDVSSEFPR